VEALAESVDAVVVGSALVDVIANAAPSDRVAEVKSFMAGLGVTPEITRGTR
jgi:tryptophan synthase alpha subunit